MHLNVIVPALNEAATIADVVRRIPRTLERIDRVQVVVIDDGSTDDTARLAREAGARVVSHRVNRGLGAALATGIKTARSAGADLVVTMDGDGQFDPADIPHLLAPILRDEADFVTCTRFARPDRIPEMPRAKEWGNRTMAWLVSRLAWNARFTDVSCGFRAYTRDTLNRLTLLGNYTCSMETLLNLAAHGARAVEVPLEVRGTRRFGKSRVAPTVTKYAAHALPTLVRTLRDLRPLLFFGMLALPVLAAGIGFGLFSLGHLIMTGQTSPYRSVVTASAVGLILGFLLVVLALLADMLKRQRHLLEEAVYLLRRAEPSREQRNSGTVRSGRSSVPKVVELSGTLGPHGDGNAAQRIREGRELAVR